MNRIKLVKNVTSFVVGLGTTKIVNSIIQNNVNPKTVVDQVTVVSAALVIGSMAADATKSYTDTKIDELVTWWNENITNKKPAPTE